MPAETDEIVDVCIVGAGMAGLVVAAETAAAGLRTVVVDASDRVGGMLAPVMIAGGAGVGAAGGQVAADAGAESFATRTTSSSWASGSLRSTLIQVSSISPPNSSVS